MNGTETNDQTAACDPDGPATTPDSDDNPAARDHDVVIVGGGPAGCAAGVFTAREGLDTVIFDRGRSSLKRCAHLENYLGFPAGIDIETLYELFHDHAAIAGCRLVDDLVDAVERHEDGDGFVVTPAEGTALTATRVIAATRYDGEYLRGLDDDESMFETNEHDGETHERFDRSYADTDGSTPIDGLHVASPAAETDTQAIIAAGRGARVARRVIADVRLADGWWPDVADGVDWVRRAANLDDEWADRERWVEWFDSKRADDAPVAPDTDRFERVRAAVIDASRASYLDDRELDERAQQGQATLAAHLDPAAVVAAIGAADLLDVMDEEAIRNHLEAARPPVEASD